MTELIGKICSSCGRLTDKYVTFKCPSCGNETIVRCQECRKTHTKYRCITCNFEGP
ncbi:MAG: zinc finger domain-containing protein [Candidatus Marsarchaeota archaeon]|nr:zinc finger domain-containing protein [Candidatus Marsarchaeota archaeon]